MASKVYWIVCGPRLLRVFRNEHREGHDYVPGYMESLPDKVISTINTAASLTYWTSPIVGFFLYRRGYFTHEGAFGILRLALSMAVVYAAAYIIRGIGRMGHPEYRAFINALVAARNNPTVQNKKTLNGYDFDFWAAPVDFKWNEGTVGDKKKRALQSSTNTRKSSSH